MSYLPFRPKLYRIYQNFWPLGQAYRGKPKRRRSHRIAKPKGVFFRVGNMSAARCAFWYRFDVFRGHKELKEWINNRYQERRKTNRQSDLHSGHTD